MRALFVGVLVATAAIAQDKPPAGDAERGKAAYTKYQCYTCHGTVGQGGERGAGPKLAPNPFPWAGFQQQIRTPRQDMPAYRKEHLPDQDLADIYAYLFSTKVSPPAKDIELLREF
jgi:ubiquinol-cytochrome c reductase cytochrome c subunit